MYLHVDTYMHRGSWGIISAKPLSPSASDNSDWGKSIEERDLLLLKNKKKKIQKG